MRRLCIENIPYERADSIFIVTTKNDLAQIKVGYQKPNNVVDKSNFSW